MPTNTIIYVDCPWWYSPRNNPKTKFGGGAPGQYPTMKTKDLCALPVDKIGGAESLLFMWSTGPRQEDALQVMHSWGFKFSTVVFVWIKMAGMKEQEETKRSILPFDVNTPVFGPGNYTASNAEFVLLGRRKKPPKPARNDVCSVVFQPRLKPHSRKPEDVAHRIELMYPDAPKLELFGRRARPGWAMLGNQRIDQ